MKTSRSYRDIGLDEVCLVCGKVFGAHSGLRCPKPDGIGHIADERFYSVADCPGGIVTVTVGNPTLTGKVGPRKPTPAIPPEIHSSKPFDPVAAWEAVKALSKGS